MNLAVRDIRHNLGRFALTTLGIGLLVSMFTAIVVTRTFMRVVFERSGADELRERRWLLGY